MKVGNGAYKRIGCNKYWLVGGLEDTQINLNANECVKVDFMVETYEPSDERACIDAVRSKPVGHVCQYQPRPLASHVLGQSQNIRSSILGDVSEQNFLFRV